MLSKEDYKLFVKKKNCFNRCLSGLRKARLLGLSVRFLTLTTPACNGEGLSSSDKQSLIQQLFRRLYYKYHKEGLINQYFSVRTAEGNGVIHVVYTGKFIDFEDVMTDWVKINGSCFVWICDPYKYFSKDEDVADYFMSQYVSVEQGVDYTYGFSHDWIYHGWFKDYVIVRKCSKKQDVVVHDLGFRYSPVDYVLLDFNWNRQLEAVVNGSSIVVQGDLGVYLE
ncbi:MAG: hypothetical protein H7836_13165 [Magnetococcus sp. YQC-3]